MNKEAFGQVVRHSANMSLPFAEHEFAARQT